MGIVSISYLLYMAESHFNVLQELGCGSFATVFKVRRLLDDRFYALKKVKVQNMRDKDLKNALNEVRLLSLINHENIVGYKEAFLDSKGQHLCLVMQYADKGDVQLKLKNYKQKRRRFTEAQIWKAVSQTAAGLAYLHANNIIHRDIKPANIFIFSSENGNVYKLGDLNVSKLMTSRLASTQTGTPYFCSPEVWKGKPYDFRSDIYSLGCSIYQMASQRTPYQAKSLDQLFKCVMKNQIPKIPKNYSAELFQLIRRCMSLEAGLRPSALQIVQQAQRKLDCQTIVIDRPRARSFDQNFKNKTLILQQLKVRSSAFPQPKYDILSRQEEIRLPRLSADNKFSQFTKSRTEKSRNSRSNSDNGRQPMRRFRLK